MWDVRDVLYAVLYVRVSCFVVRGCGVSDAVDKAIKSQERNVVLDCRPPPISSSEKRLNQKGTFNPRSTKFRIL